jgi:hypothetical protein
LHHFGDNPSPDVRFFLTGGTGIFPSRPKKQVFWRKSRPEINAINHTAVNSPRRANAFTTTGLNCAAITQRLANLYTLPKSCTGRKEMAGLSLPELSLKALSPATEASRWMPIGCAGALAAKMIWDFVQIDYMILRNIGKLR